MKLWLLYMILIAGGCWYNEINTYVVCSSEQKDVDNLISSDDQLFLSYLSKDECGGTTFRTYPFTSINVGGFYRLADNISNQVTISVSNVTLDMNGCTISGGTHGIVINSGLSNITIKNGSVVSVAGDGVQVNSGCSDITLDMVTAQSAQRGFFLQNVTNGVIRNCDLISSNTGLELNFCKNIALQGCKAQTNKYAGFSLVSSTTCSLLDCESLSTGQSNSDQNTSIYGFVNSAGYGNIFERCIADSTQGLAVTGDQVVVAGFALLGTGTQSHKIVDSKAANSMTSFSGVTLPYGIWLENTLSSSLTLTAAPTTPVPGATVNSVDWTSDGQYLAVGSNSSDSAQLRVYKYDRLLQKIYQVATPSSPPSANVLSVNWSPDSSSLLITTNAFSNPIKMYRFDRINNTLTQLNLSPNPGGTTFNGAWTPDGLYFAITSTSAPQVRLYFFDKTSLTSTQVATLTLSAAIDLMFSSNGIYIAITSAASPFLHIYQFNRQSNTLTLFASASPALSSTGIGVAFSPDDKYVAAVSAGPIQTLSIYSFNKSLATLTFVASVTPGVVGGVSFDWSADGKFLVVGSADTLITYRFDRGANTITQVASSTINGSSASNVRFSPDGRYVALAANSPRFLSIYQAMNFPMGNMIMNNKVYSDLGSRFNEGIGISGSSIDNMIVGNTSYNNLLNYTYVCNVFNQLFGYAPTELQNSTGDLNIVRQTPMDLPTQLQRVQYLAQLLVDNLI